MFIKNIVILMMKSLFIILILYDFSYSQHFNLLNTIGKFENASSFYIASNGFIYVTDKFSNEVIQIDTLGNELKDVGGFGWNISQFDEPIDVYADPLSVYITDKNNHRIQRFDRNLNFISQLYTRENKNSEERFGYPLGCVVSNQGDLYILDSENKRIVKFDLFGNFKLNFGGIDAGEFSLNNPKALSIDSKGVIFVADENYLIAFDQFGNGISKSRFDEKINSIEIIFDRMIITTENQLYYINTAVETPEVKKLILDDFSEIRIVSALLFNDKLLILSPNEIFTFRLSSE
jgi:DNA-binding beta-propeller fold protein YncE